MAYLIPANLGSRSDAPSAVQQVAAAFRELVDDDVTVVHDSRLEGAPLMVIDPRAGVALLDVVEGGARGLGRGRLLSFVRRTPALEDLTASLHDEAARLVKRLSDSAHLGRRIPVAAVPAAPTVSRAKAAARGHEPDRMLLQEDFRPNALRAAVARVLGGALAPLAAREERAVRAAVSPEIVIRDRAADGGERPGQLVFRAPVADGEDVLAVLDRQQQNLAMHLGDGYRVIRGVAGSGKSLVLTHRARFLASAFPQWRVLVTCFNIAIGRALAAQLADLDNVVENHVDSLAFRVCRDARVRIPNDAPDVWTRRRLAAASAVRDGTAGDRYDVVLVDEAQDLDAAGLDLAHAALAPGRDQFVVALDAAQNIFRKRHRWNPPGMTARGRTTLMKVNYRNTKEILELAWALAAPANTTPDDGGLDDPSVVVPPEATSRRGPEPTVVQAADARGEIEAVADQLEAYHDRGASWSDMLVLFGNRRLQNQLYRETRRRRIPYFCVSLNASNKRAVMDAPDAVRASNIHSIKGLEFGHVLVCGVNDITVGPDEQDDDVTRRRLLYVGMTRATDHLFMTVSGGGALGRDLLAAAS